jgi:hypothetical protein
MKKTLILMMLVITINLFATEYNPGNYTLSSKGFKENTTNFATLTIGKDGKIQNLLIDVIIPIDKDNLKKGYTTKRIAGDNYGMKKESKIGKEWYEQIDIVAERIVNDQGVNFTANSDGRVDTIAGATIRVGEYLPLIEDLLKKAIKK